jgi:hypothetical protein
VRRAAAVAIALVLFAGCGKKGPPLAPIVRLPAAPAELAAERRGGEVRVRFVVPSANTDGSRPADVGRVEVYAMSAPRPADPAVLLADGAIVATVDVKAPRDPSRTIGPEEPASALEVLEGPGSDQGAAVEVSEELTPALGLLEGAAAAGAVGEPEAEENEATETPVRSYVAVAVSTRGRRGPPSRPAAVPLTATPPAPAGASVSYDESVVTIEWPPSPPPAPLLEGYHVYEIDERQGETRLTEAPVAEARFSDRRIEWGRERCYTVRAVHAAGSLALESEPSPPACATLEDTFPPPPPAGPIAVASEGAINLIWEPSPAADVAGYVVSRGRGPDGMKPLTPAPIAETTFRDVVDRGVRYAYIVTAVDRAGNVSGPSARVEETAR